LCSPSCLDAFVDGFRALAAIAAGRVPTTDVLHPEHHRANEEL
jgi:hypothetical protein